MRDDDYEYDYPYAKPSVSAWVAVAAVAFAVFMLGGFIKTYRQLENLREESRREIGELKAVVESLRTPYAPASVPYQESATRINPLPQTQPRTRRPSPPPPPPVPEPPPVSTRTQRSRIPEIDDANQRITYSIGRTSPQSPTDEEAGLSPHGNPGRRAAVQASKCQVVAVNSAQKRIMIEGGRDMGFGEGSRLELSREGRWIGDLRVLDVFDTLSACEVLHATLPPEPGDMVRMP